MEIVFYVIAGLLIGFAAVAVPMTWYRLRVDKKAAEEAEKNEQRLEPNLLA